MRPATSEPNHQHQHQHHHHGGPRRPADGPRPHARGPSTNHRQEWVPRSSAPSAAASSTAPPILPSPPPPAVPAVCDVAGPSHRPRRHHRHLQQQQQAKQFQSHRAAPMGKSEEADAGVVPPPDPSLPQLVQEIQDKLSRGAVECMICYDMVGRSAPIWSCCSCYSIFHLHCIRKWARSPTSADAPPLSASSSSSSSYSGWRCPGCQSVQSTPAKDLIYTCFCGNRRDPHNDLYLTPHSCGEPCRKPLSRSNPLTDTSASHDGEDNYDQCPHVCVLQCHPGPCPPCKAFAPRRPCPCGKKTIVRRCSDRQTPLTCGQQCGRLLSCGRHRCEHVCHMGTCGPCQVMVTASCFCRKKTEVMLCGDMLMKGDLQGVDEGVFSCNSVCGRMLACGNHSCSESCHPGPCGECELLPEKIKACHCGKTKLENERKSCLDPIPTCYQVCEKILLCGIHKCKEICHEGDCPPCLVSVSQKCRCGYSSCTVECFKVSEESNIFLCDRPCGKKKSCGRHRCSERCCPLSNSGNELPHGDWDPHLCPMPCGKKLRCGQHSCQLLCHSGHCPPCLETIFTDLSCACGKTSIPPPVPCGTPVPFCFHPCMVPQQCGHSSTHTCHFGECPPCSVPVGKECFGGHVILRNILCGSKDIRCNHLCGKTRQCGMHACARICHPPPCDVSDASAAISATKSSCGQVCGAPRRDCKHTCTAPCHPGTPCPDLRCDIPVTITCSCGRIIASVPCSAGGNTSGFHVDTVFEASILQKLPVPLQPVESNLKKIPLGQRKLTCDEECAKLERKRVLADAFEIIPPNLDALHFGENSSASESLSDLFRREPKWVLAVEERFKFMVLGKTKGGSSMTGLRVHVFCPMIKEKRDAIRIIAERWKLSVQDAGWEPKRFLAVHVTSKSKPPARILGFKPGTPVTAPQPPAFDPLVDMDPRLVVSMLDLPRDADISALVLRFGGECELVWLNDKNALAVFSDPSRAATALRRLDHGSVYHGATVIFQNGSLTAPSVPNAWGVGSKEGGGGFAPKSSNPWKKDLAPEADSWGGDWSTPGTEAAMLVWNGNESPSLSVASTNPWNVLNSDPAVSMVSQGSTANLNTVSGMQGSSQANLRTSSDSTSVAGTVNDLQPIREVDNWEEACD